MVAFKITSERATNLGNGRETKSDSDGFYSFVSPNSSLRKSPIGAGRSSDSPSHDISESYNQPRIEIDTFRMFGRINETMLSQFTGVINGEIDSAK